ncbi:uracil phosphoribosyltransferase, partial [Cupriavidus metallidurans]
HTSKAWDAQQPCKTRLPPLLNHELCTVKVKVRKVDVLKRRGVKDESITFVALVAAPEGVEVFQKAHPGVKLYVASLDNHLDDHAYIVPGLGDAGDRLFGTKN